MRITTTTIHTPHGDVGAEVGQPKDGVGVGMLLAHGAGGGRHHPWMVALRDRLVGAGITTMTFDYAYMHAGRKAPDRLPKLLDVHRAVYEDFSRTMEAIVIGGKSMGGRVGGHLVAEGMAEPSGIIYYGYPLVALGKTEPRPTDHLCAIGIPQLFISGDRDRLGPVDLVRPVADAVPGGTLVVIESGDHSFVPLKASGRTLDDSLDVAVAATTEWIARIVDPPVEG